MKPYMSSGARALEADMQADEFRPELLRIKAPTTWRLLDAVMEALVELPYGHPLLGTLDRLSIALSYDAQRGAEHGPESVEYVDGLLAQAMEMEMNVIMLPSVLKAEGRQ